MPTIKKRINLTVSEKVYEQLQAYKADNGIESDASACLQLIVQQLSAQENLKQFKRLYNSLSIDELKQLSVEGISFIKQTNPELK